MFRNGPSAWVSPGRNECVRGSGHPPPGCGPPAVQIERPAGGWMLLYRLAARRGARAAPCNRTRTTARNPPDDFGGVGMDQQRYRHGGREEQDRQHRAQGGRPDDCLLPGGRGTASTPVRGETAGRAGAACYPGVPSTAGSGVGVRRLRRRGGARRAGAAPSPADGVSSSAVGAPAPSAGEPLLIT